MTSELSHEPRVDRGAVESHLGSIYRKLDIKARSQLTSALAADDPGPRGAGP